MRIVLSLVGMHLLVLVSCPVAARAAEPGERKVGEVYGRPVTAKEVGLAGPIDVKVKFDARDKERWELMGRVMKAFGGPVSERFIKEKKVEATAEEVEAFGKKRPGTPEEVAKHFILAWKVERELHRTFGGRVIFQQFGPEALDARKKLFEQAEKAGDLRFDDAGVRHLFYYYSNMRHTEIEAEALEKPWFF